MKERPPQSNRSTARRFLLYVALVMVITAFVEENHFSLLITVLLSLFFIIPELISNYKSESLAFLFFNTENIKQGENYKLTSVEEEAVHLYAKQKWSKPKPLLINNHETEVLFLINLQHV